MAIANVVTRGYGPSSSIGFVVTRGYSPRVVVPPQVFCGDSVESKIDSKGASVRCKIDSRGTGVESSLCP